MIKNMNNSIRKYWRLYSLYCSTKPCPSYTYILYYLFFVNVKSLVKYNWFWQSLYQYGDSIVGLQSTEFSETPSPDSDSVNSLEGHSEPSWFKDIKFDDSDTEQLADETDYVTPSKCLTTVDILYQTVLHFPWSTDLQFYRLGQSEQKNIGQQLPLCGW